MWSLNKLSRLDRSADWRRWFDTASACRRPARSAQLRWIWEDSIPRIKASLVAITITDPSTIVPCASRSRKIRCLGWRLRQRALPDPLVLTPQIGSVRPCVLVTENPAAAMDICDERRLQIPIGSFPLFYIPAPSIRETATVSACRRFGIERTLKPGTLASQAAADQPSIGPRARSRSAK
jgi:hypothetical protein